VGRRIDKTTKRWIRNAADERAASRGYYFDEWAADTYFEFCEEFCCHSKGEWAGKPLLLDDWQKLDVYGPMFGWKRRDGLRRFRTAYQELPKKNGKSTSAAATGLFMTVADGEPGAEVYSAATDQQQASIVHGEAVLMVDQSPALSSVLKINRSTKNIAFEAANSLYRAWSGGAGGKEGFNPHCVICDELHVWKGRELWSALKWGFAVRRQPLLFIITTAGDDDQSVCFEQHTYAKGVISGEIPDDHYFAYIRAIEPNDDWKDPAVWKKANPALGITLKLDKFAEEVAEAERTPASIAAFQRYRLNRWATAANPWIPPGAWGRCRATWADSMLKGELCWAGLDLAKTRDMTACVLDFPRPDGRHAWLPFFWMPEATINSKESPEYLRVWRDAGLLRETPGDVCDYSVVLQDLIEFSQLYRIMGLCYDPNQAEHLTQLAEETIGVVRVSFPQGIAAYNEPTSEAERLILDGRLEHFDHKILSWQFGHVQVYTNAKGYMMPVKPKKHSPLKIDGVVAGIMALHLAMINPTDGGGQNYLC
jgi:phage terminase large subunit-like protein